ncbi:hypothetical protein DFH07DRAFT_987882 [Mycena maculata]|uniref:Uncharacterized protein n=1 Tax=Mycena maculata TaxID=230809 RepID=A0AAD7I488_9AGAR|nr:hypothetical protein DFH07DRAFT_987882 [Mycena maculata]
MSSDPTKSTRRGTAGTENHHAPKHDLGKERDSKRRRIVSANSEGGFYLNPFGAGASLPLNGANHSPPRPRWTIPADMQLPPEQWSYEYTPERTAAEQEIYQLGKKSDPPPSTQFRPEDAPSFAHFASPEIDPSLSPLIPPVAGPVQKPKPNPTPPSIMFPFGSSSKATTPFAATPQPQNRAPNCDPNVTPVSSDPIPSTLTSRSVLALSKNHASQIASSSSRPRSVSNLDDNQPASPVPETPFNLPRPQAAAIPKAVTDKLMKHNAQIRGLEDNISRMTWEVNILTDRDMAEGVKHDVNDLENEQIGLEQRVDVLEETIAKQNETIERLLQIVEQRGGIPEAEAEEVPAGKQKRGRDNALNNATRKSLYVAMGLASTSQLKAAATLVPSKKGGSYIKDRESVGKLLRPDWGSSFAENIVWHDPMVKFLRAKGPALVPALTSAILAQKSDQELLDRLEVVFKNKCEERIATIDEGRMHIPTKHKYILQPIYQSTDESDDTDIVDPDTETEADAEVPAKTTHKPWITRPPAYRCSETEAAIFIV